MNFDRVKDIADAILYEGYILYPYRPSSVKNRQRWTFGCLFPHAFGGRHGDASAMQTQALLTAGADAALDLHVRFLQVQKREIGALPDKIATLPPDREPAFTSVASLEVDGGRVVAFDEAIERNIIAANISLRDLLREPRWIAFAMEAARDCEPLRNAEGAIEGLIIRSSARLEGLVAISAEDMGEIAPGLIRLTIRVENESPLEGVAGADRASAQRQAFASAHAILALRNGAFISLLDPPEGLRAAAKACDHQGVWPVLVGDEHEKDMMLASPIILYDYPKIAPESPGELFDGTEIDEILTLRILTLIDEEKREMAAADPRGRALLQRCETLTPQQLDKLHGALRRPGSLDKPPIFAEPASNALPHLASLNTSDGQLSVGDRVRIHPRAGGDIMDIALKDKVAIVERIERDFEDRIHVAVTLLDDPGRDLGAAGFPGHRFFFSQDELEPMRGRLDHD